MLFFYTDRELVAPDTLQAYVTHKHPELIVDYAACLSADYMQEHGRGAWQAWQTICLVYTVLADKREAFTTWAAVNLTPTTPVTTDLWMVTLPDECLPA